MQIHLLPSWTPAYAYPVALQLLMHLEGYESLLFLAIFNDYVTLEVCW